MPEKDFLAQYSKFLRPTDLNLRKVVLDTDSALPIALLLNAQSTYVVRNIYSIAQAVPREEPSKGALDPSHCATRIQMLPTDNIKWVMGNILLFVGTSNTELSSYISSWDNRLGTLL